MSNWISGTFTAVKHDEFKYVFVFGFWNYMQKSEPEALQLAKLALVVLSVAINTATCERLFSEWGLIQTARRNKLNENKTKNLGIIRKFEARCY